MSLSNKACIITGSSSGIGLATAIMFAGRGASVCLCGRNQERLLQAHHQCTQASGGHADRFITVLGDVTDASVRKDIVAKTIEKFGRLDVLVLNAGILPENQSITNATEDAYDCTMGVNVKSSFFLIQTALPHLEKSKGNIIVVSSITSSMVLFPGIIYPMTKAALDHMTRCLAVDLGPKGIRINAVKPPGVVTRIMRDVAGDNDLSMLQGFLENDKPLHPLEGKLAEPDDIAEAISFLASDASKFITGECLNVDGGRQFMGMFTTKSATE